MHKVATHTVLALFTLLLSIGPPMNPNARVAAAVVSVQATVETVPVAHSGDAADDAAVWIHPTDRSQSVILGTDKQDGGGLAVYNLDGTLHQFVPAGKLNNVDIRYHFPFGGGEIDLVAVSDRTANSIAFFRMDADTRTPVNITGTPIDLGAGFQPYGMALYHSLRSGKFYAFVNKRDGDMGTTQQYEIADNGVGGIAGTLVRTFDVGSLSEGMAVDDLHGQLFIGEEDVGIWKYGPEPTDGASRTLVAPTTASGPLVDDVEGLAIYRRAGGDGYLIASSQGNNTYAVYDLTGTHAFRKSFQIVAGAIDGTNDTDGIRVTNADLGPAFPSGLFVAQDGSNPGGNQNFKVVPWSAIATDGTPALDIDTTFDPRAIQRAIDPGDMNGDGAVDRQDAASTAIRFGTPAGATFDSGDFDGDGAVTLSDVGLLQARLESLSLVSSLSVPEPSAWLLAAIGLAATMARHWHR